MYIRNMRGEQYLKNGLQNICDYVNGHTNIKKMCEVGTYRGESSIIFLNNFKNLEEFIGVDPYSTNFNSDNLFTDELAASIKDEFLQKIKPFEFAKLLQKCSADASHEFANEYFDFIYIDGCHKIESVISDTTNWLPKIKKGGFLSFHDVNNDGVRYAISQFFNIDDGYITEDQSITFKI